ncbi:MAG TPA: trehalose-phosphatase [Candidatus Krumholzibacteria bacterium]|nr:trehalose-phosphatase [Candidatus Krumholzibacteria bacterium]HPD70976.1 trehalose-phosphatase [Candidatus Krumholzibacteria bacterium]HRY39324.1 trehalose-phosphatase [Candidatus Krumholzibacteria bacterium]
MDVPAGFWDELRAAPRALLALDYDGTLAPFRAERRAARPYPGVGELIDAISREAGTRVVVVSGRPPREAAGLLGLASPPEVWGSHGWERLHASGAIDRRPVPPAARAALDVAARAAAADGWRERLEVKHASVALHWRGDRDPPRAAAAGHAILAPYADGRWLEVLEFAAGLELRCRGWHKGHVLKQLLSEEPGAVVAYLGDDATDEDAFRELVARPRCLPVLVAPTPRPTAAACRLVPPGELRAFLVRWSQVRGRSQP